MEKRNGSTIAEFIASIPEEERLRIQAIFDELERDGLIYRTGQFRDVWPLYAATDKSRAKEG